MRQAFLCKKLVCDKYGVCRYCYEPPYCQSKINYKHFGIHIQLEIEKNKRKLNRATIYRGRDRMNLTDELDLCYHVNFIKQR